jgi:hypothetical protein
MRFQNVIENQAFLLAKEYVCEYRKKYGFNMTPYNRMKDSKWWPSFVKTIELFGEKENWNPHNFIRLNFEYQGKIFPSQLPTKKAWDTFIDNYREEEDINYKNIALALLNDINTIKKLKLEKIDLDSIRRLSFDIKRGAISIYFLSLLKPFYEYNKEENFYEEKELLTKRSIIYKNKKIYNKMKEIFGDSIL